MATREPITGLLGHVDGAHAALAEHLDHLVAADGTADQLVVQLQA